VVDLDLTNNLLGDWTRVAEITNTLAELNILRLSRNRFAPFQGLPDHLGDAFCNVHTLSLTRTLISWRDVLNLDPYLGNLENLMLAHNKITTYAVGDDPSAFYVTGFKKLKFLSLEGNGITGWREITRFSKLPQYSLSVG
jgi:hypothetical protein